LVQARSDLPFVGRQRELGDLAGALEEIGAGRGRIVLIGGEPGIGKTRLVAELADRATADGSLVLWGRGWEDAGAPAFWPWIQVLRALLRELSTDDLRRDLGLGAQRVAQIVPELHILLPEVAAAATDTQSDAARFQLFDAVTTLLRNAARRRPLVVVLDDLQAADASSILLLSFLAGQVGDMAVLLLGTYRDIDMAPDHPLATALAELARGQFTDLINLRGLIPEAVREVLAASTEPASLDRLARAVQRATGGNPLFVGEAVRLLQTEGHWPTAGDRAVLRGVVPASVHTVISRRIGYLAGTTATVLRLAAVIGPEFSLDLLSRVGEMPPEATLDAIDEAVRAGLMVAVPGGLGRYRFSHDLIRETLYDELPTAQRIRLHRRLAETLDRGGSAAGEAHLPELAFHYVQAAQIGATGKQGSGDDGVRVKAIEYSRRAGDQAARQLAFEEAARLYRMALTAMDVDDAPPAGSTAHAELRVEVLLALGDVLSRVGDVYAARISFLEAARLARPRGAGGLVARATLGYGGRHHWARAGNDGQLLTLLEEALAALGKDDPRLRVRLLTRLACAWRSVPEHGRDSDALSREAVELARTLDEPETLSYSLIGRMWATWWPENPEQRERISSELMSLAEAAGDDERMAEAHLARFLSLAEAGRMAAAKAELSRLARVVERLGQPAELWLGPATQGWLALLDGDLAGADALIALEFGSGFRVTPILDDLSAARMHRFLLRREQGRLAEEEASVRAAVREFPWYPLHRAALACLLLEVGKRRESGALFAELAVDGFAALPRDNEWLLGMCLASDVCSGLGDRDAAQVLYDQLLPFAGRHAIAHAEGSVGVVDHYLGKLATTLGTLDDAERHLASARQLLALMGAQTWQVHADHDLARCLRQRRAPGDVERAAQLDREARAAAVVLGMALAEDLPTEAGSATGTTATGTTAVASVAGETGTLRRDGDYWTIEFGSDAFRLRDAKGLHHLARLLADPGAEVHALELAQALAPSTMPGERRAPAGSELSELTSRDFGDSGPLLDATAKAAYRHRLEELRGEIEEASSWNDPERVARLEAEMSALTRELAAAFGLGDRARAASSPAERARVSVTKSIRTTLHRIDQYSPALGAHLNATVRTGTFCVYAPDPRAPISWRL
jgi:tetratricopeptide (TPR) repeat protein